MRTHEMVEIESTEIKSDGVVLRVYCHGVRSLLELLQPPSNRYSSQGNAAGAVVAEEQITEHVVVE